jgi:hypothetical protein
MALKSAIEDVLGTTLAPVSGLLGRLDYLSSLRGTPGGSYSHWGLARVHGQRAAQEALAEAHHLLYLKLLRTSLRALQADAAISGEALAMAPGEYVENLRRRVAVLLPPDLGGGSPRHFSSMLHALSSLASTASRNP